MSAVNVLSSVHTFSGDEVFSVDSEFVRISELNLCQWCSSSWVMDDSSDDTLDEAGSLSVVVVSECSWGDSVNAVDLVDTLWVTLSLG